MSTASTPEELERTVTPEVYESKHTGAKFQLSTNPKDHATLCVLCRRVSDGKWMTVRRDRFIGETPRITE